MQIIKFCLFKEHNRIFDAFFSGLVVLHKKKSVELIEVSNRRETVCWK